ncbi:MAG: HAD family hydrolase [Xenococcaceae cyanobacterium]
MRISQEIHTESTPYPTTCSSLDFIVAPLAKFLNANAAIATLLETENGRFTGKIAGLPLAGDEKARAMRNLSGELGIDLSRSYAYGVSFRACLKSRP